MDLHPFWLIGATGLLAMIPVFLGVATTYLKMSIVLNLVKNALGTQQVPGPLIVSAVSLALTYYVMSPICAEMISRYEAIHVSVKKQSFSAEALQRFLPVAEPLVEFLKKHSGPREIQALREFRQNHKEHQGISEEGPIASLTIIIPAFMLTELREAFMMGFVVLLPFLVIDLIVANLLTGLGMYMMSPVTISLPLKLILFVASDAWLFIARGLLQSYGVD